MKEFFAELKRRNVYKVAVAYGVVAWLLIQIATQVFPFFEIPNWAVRLVVLLVVIGFPIALMIAWAFESTPEGIKRTAVADAAREHSRGKAWIYIVIVGAFLSIGVFFLGRYTAGNGSGPEDTHCALRHCWEHLFEPADPAIRAKSPLAIQRLPSLFPPALQRYPLVRDQTFASIARFHLLR